MRRLSSRFGGGNVWLRFIRDGQWFSKKVLDYLTSHRIDVCGKFIFSYDTTALELFAWARERGALCVLGQMDPGRTEMEIVREESARWQGWSASVNIVPEEYQWRRETEWGLADRIIVNSSWSRDALMRQGVPAEKLVVIPLCYEATGRKPRLSAPGTPPSNDRPLQVLFLGQVILRKGIQYLIEAARRLHGKPVRFFVVGPIGISRRAVTQVPPNVTFHGRVRRDETAGWYERSDVFVLPTISDGFAITQIEAMAHGLPVIATPHCGEVVTDGVDGYVVPARNVDALVAAISRYLAEPELLRSHRSATQRKVTQFNLEHLADRLCELETELSVMFAHTGRVAGRLSLSP